MLYNICKYFNITISEFYDTENLNPDIINRIINNLKSIDEKNLISLEVNTKDLRKYHRLKKQNK